MLRGRTNGESAAKPTRQRSTSRRHGLRGQVLGYSTPLINIGITEGTKDIESFTDSQFRKATAEEITDEETEGYILALRADSEGSKVFKVLNTSAYISQKAYLADAEDGDTDIIYVKKGLYSAERVTPSGAYTESDVTGGKKYTFSVESSTGYAKSTCTTSGIPDCGSGSAKFVITPNGANSIKVVAYNSDGGVASTQYWSGYASSATISYVVSTPPSGGGGGSVTVLKSTAPTYSGKKLVPAVLQKETTTEKRYAHWRYIPSECSKKEKTFLVQQGSTATQNFAFGDIDT